MTEQREQPGIDVEELCAMLGISSKGSLVSGGIIENFQEGWAHVINLHSFSNVGHYFTRCARIDSYFAFSKCGLSVITLSLYGIGNFPKCKRCLKSMNKSARPMLGGQDEN